MLDKETLDQLKEVFVTKKELNNSLVSMETRIYSQISAMNKEMKSNYEALLTNSDKMLEIISTHRQEQILVIKDQEVHKNWIHQIADEIDVVLQS